MHKKRIRLGNTVFCVESTMPLKLGGNLPLFKTEDDADITICVRYAQPESDTPDAHGYAKIEQERNRIFVDIRQGSFPRLSIWQVLNMLPLSKLLMERGTLVCHGSCVIDQGRGIAFSGPSGIGKSTQADLWKTHRNAKIINGDRLLLTVNEDGMTVGSHYLSGTSGICVNATAPLGVIVLLEQARQNHIFVPSPLDCFRRILSQLDYDITDRTQMVMVTGLVEKLMARMPVVAYACRMDESAVTDLENYLNEKCYTKNDP